MAKINLFLLIFEKKQLNENNILGLPVKESK
jgi:hypothetical protein